MSLTNMLREPRREIIETAVGLALVAPLAGVDYYIAVSLQAADHKAGPLVLYMLLAAAVVALIVCGGILLLGMIHALGEVVCKSLARHGIELRPVRRY